MQSCLKTINDSADEAHLDDTPSVQCLIEIGEPALLPLTELLMANDEMTRLRAMRATEMITYNMWMEAFNQDEELALDDWINWWKEIGYSEEGDSGSRNESVLKLKGWIAERQKKETGK